MVSIRLIPRIALFALIALSLTAAIYPYTRSARVSAASASTINFQARLLTSSGAVVPDGDYNVEFKLYDTAAAGGTAQGVCSLNSSTDDCWWIESRTGANKVTTKNGYLTVALGDTTAGGTAFGANVPWDQELWLSFRVGGTGVPGWEAAEMSPRMKVTAVPYAFAAASAQTLKVTNGANSTTVSVTAPTAARTISFQDNSGVVPLGTTGNSLFFTTSGPTNLTLPTSGTVTVNPASGYYLHQVPTSNTAGTNGANVIAPTTNSITGLTINGTTGTAATAFSVVQGGAATAVTISSSNTGTGQVITLANTAGTQTNGLLINRNGAGGTTTNLLNLTNTAGTATNGIVFTGTITNDITTTAARALTVRTGNNGAGASGGTTISTGTGTTSTGVLNLTTGNASAGTAGNITIDVGTSTAGAPAINIGTAASTAARTIALGGTAQTGTITVGQATTAATAILNIQSANGTSSTQTINIGGGTSTTAGGKVVNIANGIPGAGTTNTIAIGTQGAATGTVGVTIGSNGAAAHTTTIQGGNGASALALRTASGGTLSIQNTGLAGTVQIGNTTGAVAQTINIGNNATASSTTTVVLGSTIGTSTTTINAGVNGANTTLALQAAASGIITVGSQTAANTINLGTVGAAAFSSTVNIATSTAAAQTVNIGSTNTTSTTTINAGSGNLILNASTLQRTAAGTTNLNLIDAANTTLAIQNSGAGVANLTVDGTINGLTLTSAADGYTIAGGTTSRTLTVTGANITVGSTITPTAAGTLNVSSNGANVLNLNGGTSGAVNIGNTSTGDILLGGGSASTGCTVTNSSGAFACTSTLQGTQLVSTIATGTSPLTVTSTTVVTNLNADLLDGLSSASFAPSATNGYVQLAPASVQTDATTNNSVFLNKTNATGNLLQVQRGGTDVLVMSNTGAATFKNQADSTSAFSVQNTAGTSLLRVDTSGRAVNLIGSNLYWGTATPVTGAPQFIAINGSTLQNTTNTSQYGMQMQPNFDLSGVNSLGDLYSIANLANVSVAPAAAGVITRATGQIIRVDNTANAPITDLFGLRVANGSGTGTVNKYGIYVDNVTGGSSVNYPLFLKSSGTSQLFSVNNTGQAVFRNSANSTTALQVLNTNAVSIINVDTTNGELEVGNYNGGTNPVNGRLALNNSTNANTVTILSGATAANYTLTLPTADGAAGDCLKDTNGSGVLGFSACGGGGTLQNAYDAGVAGDQIIALDATQDSLIFRNPAASGTDSAQLLTIDQLNTGAKDALKINNAGTGNILNMQDAGTTVLKVVDGGHLLGASAATGTTGTTEATARTNVTTVTLTAAGAFANNDVIFINNAGQDYYTRITAGGGTTTLTVSPAVSYDVSAAVTKYTIQNIGATATDYTTQANRFFQGYFLGGVVTGAGSTTYSDGWISAGPGLTIKNPTDSTAAFQVLDSSGSWSYLKVNTTSDRVEFGAANIASANLLLWNSANGNGITIQPGATSAAYTLTLPTSVGSANQCLANSGTAGVLTFTSCGGANTFVQGGNSFTAAAVLGTNDAYNLQFETGGSTKATLSTAGQLRIENSGTSARITLAPYNSGTTNLWNMDNSAGTLRIYREDWAASGAGINGAVRLQITNGGYVGIGSHTPIREFDLLQAAATNASGLVVRSATTATNVAGQLWAGTGGFVVQSTLGDLSGSANIHLRTGATDRLVVLGASGNVGIGTSAATSNLDVVNGTLMSGTTKSGTFTVSGGSLGTTAGNEVNIASFGVTTSNQSYLSIRAYRDTNGTDWTTSAFGIGMDVDSTVRAGASIWLNSSGNVGIGTATPAHRFETIIDSTSQTTYAASFQNNTTADTGAIMSLRFANRQCYGDDTQEVLTGHIFVALRMGANLGGRIDGFGNSNAGDCNAANVRYGTSAADFAEYFYSPSNAIEQPKLHEIVSLGDDSNAHKSGGATYGKPLVGVVSNTAGFVGNGPICNADAVAECDQQYAQDNVLVGMMGQLKVKINSEGGYIAAGDPIGASSVRGVGKKMTSAGYIVGYAMESDTDGDSLVKIKLNTEYYSPSDFDVLQANTMNISGTGTVGSGLNVAGMTTLSGGLIVNGNTSFNGNVTVTGDVSITGNLTVNNATINNLTINGHIITAGNTPTATIGTAAGIEDTQNNIPAPNVTIDGNDTAGTITIVAGASTTNGTLAEVVFDKPFVKTPRVMLNAGNEETSNLRFYRDAEAGKFRIKLSQAPTAGQTYSFDYFVIE